MACSLRWTQRCHSHAWRPWKLLTLWRCLAIVLALERQPSSTTPWGKKRGMGNAGGRARYTCRISRQVTQASEASGALSPPIHLEFKRSHPRADPD